MPLVNLALDAYIIVLDKLLEYTEHSPTLFVVDIGFGLKLLQRVGF